MCVKDGVWQSCVWQRQAAEEEKEEEEERGGTESKARPPHKDVGK